MKQELIYVSGPYSAQTHEERGGNTKRAMEVALALIEKGHLPVVPHLTHYLDILAKERGVDIPWEKWIEIDIRQLISCDSLYRIAPSRGADIELWVARSHNLTVYTSLDQVPTVLQEA